jgi:hypothetical protein
LPSQKQVIESIVEEYINLLEQDKDPTVKEFIKQYPNLVSDLRPRLEVVRLLIEDGKEIPVMEDEMRQRLHALFWKKFNESKKIRRLKIQKDLDKLDK